MVAAKGNIPIVELIGVAQSFNYSQPPLCLYISHAVRAGASGQLLFATLRAGNRVIA